MAIDSERGIIAARQAARELARNLGFNMADQSRIATAVSELTRNVVKYATNSQGRVTVRVLQGSDGPRGIEVVVEDDGPGIEDVQRAMRDGYTSGGGLGLGLPGARRLMDEMTVESAAGKGTKVTVRRWLRGSKR